MFHKIHITLIIIFFIIFVNFFFFIYFMFYFIIKTKPNYYLALLQFYKFPL